MKYIYWEKNQIQNECETMKIKTYKRYVYAKCRKRINGRRNEIRTKWKGISQKKKRCNIYAKEI